MAPNKETSENTPATDKVEELIGSAPALVTDRGQKPPDIRDVSVRWLAGTVLTGLTSITLMGGALFAALDGQEEFAKPSFETLENEDATAATANAATASLSAKEDLPPLPVIERKDRNILHLSTLTRTSTGNRVRTRPFAFVEAGLARREGDAKLSIPKFDPITIFSGSSKFREKGEDDILYDSQVEDEIELRDQPFPFGTRAAQAVPGFSDEEIEATIRRQLPLIRSSLDDGTIIASAGTIAYVDPTRFDIKQQAVAKDPLKELVVIQAENVSTIEKTNKQRKVRELRRERVMRVKEQRAVGDFIAKALRVQNGADAIASALNEDLTTKLSKKHRIRMAYAGGPELGVPDVYSVYEGDKHITTIARDDEGNFVKTDQPDSHKQEGKKPKRQPVLSTQPTVYRAIFETALKNGVPRDLVRELIRIYAFDVDFRRATRPTDKMEVFLSLDADSEQASEESEVLYTSVTLDGLKRRFYRFKSTDDGVVDYYDENGRSAKKFLMRQPVPRARFRSRFGWRRHPILRTMRLHKGVDWSAPTGTPILAAGNGVIEDAKWFSGYGRWIKIRHANGYKTGYAHMSRFAKGIKSGVRVRQGQIIGYVGSTGLSTGPHLHYEVIVNGRHVDPMGIRLPRGRVLKGEQLAAFERERDRIDQLLKKPEDTEGQDFAFNTAN